MASEFQPGDTVRLKSGGVLMTVSTVAGETVICAWQTEQGSPMSGAYLAVMLELVERKEGDNGCA
jgi:uncharacterized protein YodC (DUF2158 family)